MYVHYGCRCPDCCKAEHLQYLKRAEAKNRKRTHSKWETEDNGKPHERESQRVYNKKRWSALKVGRLHTRTIVWTDLFEKFGGKCAICGIAVDPSDTWIWKHERRCYGRNYPTVDHIIPLKCGGTDTMDNVQLTCKRCNSKKGAKGYAVAV